MKKNDESVKPGYKNTPLGVIPEDWEVSRLGEVGSFSKGGGISKLELSDEGLPCVRYGEIYTTHDYIIKEFKSFISADVSKLSKRIYKGDILFAGSGETLEDIGKAVAFIGEEEAFGGGDIIIFSPTKDEVQSESLAYILDSYCVRKQRARLGVGNQIVHIYAKDLKTILIPVPPLSEQIAIAKIISTWDEAIDKTRQLIEQKELRKKALMQQLLTGKKRLKGFTGEWRVVEVSKGFKFIKSYSISRDGLVNSNHSSGIYCIHYGDIHAFYESDFLDFNVQLNIPQIKSSHFMVDERDFLREGDIIIADASEDYAGVGESVVVVNIGAKIAVGGLHTIVLRCNDNSVNKLFGGYIFACEAVKNDLRKKATGTSVYSVSRTTLNGLTLRLPSNEEQAVIENILQEADHEIRLEKQKLEQLKLQKKSLMQVLLTGKKRIKI